MIMTRRKFEEIAPSLHPEKTWFEVRPLRRAAAHNRGRQRHYLSNITEHRHSLVYPEAKGDGIGSHANSYAFTGTYALTISAVTPTTPMVTVDGTLTSFCDIPGCPVTFESALGLQP